MNNALFENELEVTHSNDFLKKPPFKLFVHNTLAVFIVYTITSLVFMIDGYFVNNYVSEVGVAAITLFVPVFGFLFGLSIMLCTGAVARCGKYLGEGRFDDANKMFTKATIVFVIYSTILGVLSYMFSDKIVWFLGSNEAIYPYLKPYFTIIASCSLFLTASTFLFFFIRLDGAPKFAAFGAASSGFLNLVFDYVAIVKMDMGISGAAYGTILANILAILFLLSYFIWKKDRKLRFTLKLDKWIEVVYACYNGMSEFISNCSAAIVVYTYNHVISNTLGNPGLIAFTIINYIIFLQVRSSFAIGDAISPIISTNYGAKYYSRISKLMKISFKVMIILSAIFAFATLAFFEPIVSFAFSKISEESMHLAKQFALIIWVAFIFDGQNILVTAYHTSIHRPNVAGAITLLRSLILPILLVFVLPLFMGYKGIFAAAPMAEFLTFLLATYFYRKNSPSTIKARERDHKAII